METGTKERPPMSQSLPCSDPYHHISPFAGPREPVPLSCLRLSWRIVFDLRFHRLIYLFGREEHGCPYAGRAG